MENECSHSILKQKQRVRKYCRNPFPCGTLCGLLYTHWDIPHFASLLIQFFFNVLKVRKKRYYFGRRPKKLWLTFKPALFQLKSCGIIVSASLTESLHGILFEVDKVVKKDKLSFCLPYFKIWRVLPTPIEDFVLKP